MSQKCLVPNVVLTAKRRLSYTSFENL